MNLIPNQIPTFLIYLTFLAASSLGKAVNADLIFFTDRAAFNTASTSLTTTDFENLVGTLNFPQNYPFGTGHWGLTGDGFLIDEVRYQSLTISNDIYILGTDADSGNYVLDGAFSLVIGRQTARITLPSARSAIGFDFGQNAGGDPFLDMQITLSDGSTVSRMLNDALTSNFFGVVTDDALLSISSIRIDSGSFNYILLDNVSVGVTTVPEPGSLGLAGAGVFGIGMFRNRRRGKSFSKLRGTFSIKF